MRMLINSVRRLGMFDYCVVTGSVILQLTGLIAFNDTDTALVDYKGYLLSIVATALLILLLVIILLTRDMAINVTKLDLCVSCYVTYIGLRIVFDQNFNYDFGWMFAVWTSYFFTRFIYGRISICGIKITYVIFIFFILFHCAIVLSQYVGLTPSLNDSFRATGAFFNSGPMGIFLAGFLPLLTFVYTSKSNLCFPRYIKLLSMVTLVTALICIIISESRSALVLLIVATLLYLYLHRVQFSNFAFVRKSAFASTSIKACGLLVLACLVFFLVSTKRDSTIGRLLIWKVGLEMGKVEPLFGMGIGKVSDLYLKYQMHYFRNSSQNPKEQSLADKVNYLFNEPLHVFVEQGLVGLSLLFTVIYFSVIQTFRQVKVPAINYSFTIGNVMAITILAIFSSSMFSYCLQMPPILLTFCVAIGIAGSNTEENKIVNFNKLPLILGLLASLVLSVLISLETYGQYRIKKIVHLLSRESNHISDKLRLLNSLDSEYPNNRILLATIGKYLAREGRYHESIDRLNQASSLIADPFLSTTLGTNYQYIGLYNLSAKHLTMSVDMIPNRLYPRYLLAKMYLQSGDTLKADSIARVILGMPVKVESPATRQIKLEMKFLHGSKAQDSENIKR